MIDRRTLIKQMLFVSATVAIAPSCLLDHKKSGLPLKHMKVSTDQESVFASLLATIIPETDSPGAASLHADLFAWKMIDDCSPKKEQDSIIKGINELNQFCQSQTGQFFNRATDAERIAIVQSIEKRIDKKDNLANFYHRAKSIAIQAYTSSEYFLTNVQIYEQIPGRFHGCVKA